MHVIEATWDTETLGIETLEIEFTPQDTLEIINNTLSTLSQKQQIYCVVKTKPGCYEINATLAKFGFVFNECQFNMVINYRAFKQIQQRLFLSIDNLGREIVDINGINRIFENIDTGLFRTDRIAMNPAFGVNIASRRYKKWILACVGDPNYILYESIFDAKPIGFGFDKFNGNSVIGLLGATYADSIENGYFAEGLYKSLSYYFNLGYKTFQANMSSNNRAIINIYQFVGFKIRDYCYVFTYTKA